MTTPITLHLPPELGPMLFADCPFCLGPLPVDLASGSMDCPDCAVHLEFATEPAPLALAAAASPAAVLSAAA